MSFRCIRKIGFITLLSAYAIPASALGLGEITVESALGKPLRAYISLLGAGDDAPDISCFQLMRKSISPDHDTPRLFNAQLSMSKAGGKFRIAISTSSPMNEPALIIPLHLGCSEDITKEYTVLLDPAEFSPALPVVKLETAPASVSATQAPVSQPLRTLNEWETREGESLRGLAKSIYPRNRQMQRTFIAAVRRANPEVESSPDKNPLPPGTFLKIPDLRTLSTEALPEPKPTAVQTLKQPPKTPASVVATQQTQQAPKMEAVKKAPAPRLQIVASAPLPPANVSKSGTPQKQDQQQQNQALLAQADDQVALIMSQKNRITGLEGQIAALQGQLSAMQKQMAQMQHPASAANPKGLAVAAPQQQSAPTPLISPFWWGVASSVGMLGLIMGLHFFSQRRRQEPAYGYGLGNSNKESAAETAAPQFKSPRPTPAVKSRKPAELDMGKMDATPLSSMTVGEVNSVVEEADVYYSLGRPEEAIRLLKDYIAFNPQLGGHPESKAKPWIKLLEMYHATNARAAFEELATRYHLKFNVVKPSWDTTQDRPTTDNLEQFPHLISLITSTWNSPSCKQYLQELISDNRDGNRTGFSAEVFDDVLMLVGILNQLAETH